MEALPEGGSPKDIPEELRPKSGFGNTYCRLWWNKPSTTITRNLGTPSSSRCIHPRDPRPLTTREGARLQGFPDDYIFSVVGPKKICKLVTLYLHFFQKQLWNLLRIS